MRPSEESIVNDVTEEERDILRSLYRTNLAKERERIVAIRTEDLLFFLQCLRQKALPVGKGHFMYKDASVDAFFVGINPESVALRERHADILANATFQTFREQAAFVLKAYGNVGVKQAIYRLVSETQQGMKALHALLLSHKNMKKRLGVGDIGMYIEEYFEAVSVLLTEERIGIYRKEFQPIVQSTNAREYPRAFQQVMKQMGTRRGILLAFNDSLLDLAAPTVSTAVIHTQDEMAFTIPNGRIPLTAILGFESMGEPEDAILRRLKVID